MADEIVNVYRCSDGQYLGQISANLELYRINTRWLDGVISLETLQPTTEELETFRPRVSMTTMVRLVPARLWSSDCAARTCPGNRPS